MRRHHPANARAAACGFARLWPSTIRPLLLAAGCLVGLTGAAGAVSPAASPGEPPEPPPLVLGAAEETVADEPTEQDALAGLAGSSDGDAVLIDDAELERRIDMAVRARLAGIPRPRYIPATDILPPKGLLLLKTPPRGGEFPFALALTGYMQLRWFEFARDATSWTDSAGNNWPIRNINSFNINRFLLSFNGYVVDERLVYNFALFGTTDAGVRSGVVPIGILGWKFSEAATLGAGMSQVPGTREWLQSTPWTVGVDRSMANTFFRPGFSPGAAAVGSLYDKTLFYTAGVWNAIDGGSTGVLRRGTAMAWAGNTWWEPLGPFGLGNSDMEHHDEPVVRLGCSGVYAPTYSPSILGGNPEDTIVRLSDGTAIYRRGALGPGDSRVTQFIYRLATIDAAIKWKGVGLSGEYYFRLLDRFQGIGSFDRTSMFDQGGMGYLSWCFVPRSHEIYGRSSFVTGPYGTGQEYGGGLNWYLKESRQARLTLEALYMNRNPAQNILYPYRAGYTGTAIQTQFMVTF